MSELRREDVGTLLGMLVHDLRNPAATFGANIEFLTDVGTDDEDAREALEDLGLALDELKRGLELVAYIGRWLGGESALAGSEGDLCVGLPPLADELSDFEVHLDLPDAPARVASAAAVVECVRIFLSNAKHHARHGGATLRVRQGDDEVMVECIDTGPAMPPELRDDATTVVGQGRIKGESHGRYARFAGLLAAHAVAQSAGARLEFDGEDGAAIFRVVAPRA